MVYNGSLLLTMESKLKEGFYINLPNHLSPGFWNLPCIRDVVSDFTEEERQYLLKLYFLYEFSDRFQVISDDTPYGNIFNLVKTGLLTAEEAAQALFQG